MTPELERLAREAGIQLTHAEGQTAVGCANWAMLERFAMLVAQAENERAAAECDRISEEYSRREGHKYPELKTDAERGAEDCAAAIRSSAPRAGG